MGQPNMSNVILSYDEYIVIVKEYPGNRNIQLPGGKERENIDSVSSGERKRNSPNQPKGWGSGHNVVCYISVERCGKICQRG